MEGFKSQLSSLVNAHATYRFIVQDESHITHLLCWLMSTNISIGDKKFLGEKTSLHFQQGKKTYQKITALWKRLPQNVSGKTDEC